MLTLCNVVLCAFANLIHKIPIICDYGYPLNIFSVYLVNISLTIYQSIRLQYCFCNNIYNSFGYPKYIFFILYSYGIQNCFITAVLEGIYLKVIKIDNIGCFITYDYNNNISSYILSFIVISYLIWDLTVLILYIIKLIQIKKIVKSNNNNNNNNNNNPYNKIIAILTKIVVLTIIHELWNAFLFIYFWLLYFFEWIIVTDYLFANIAYCIGLIIIYFMIDHNNDEYIKFINIICCKLINNNLITIKKKKQQQQQSKNISKTIITATTIFSTQTNEFKINIPVNKITVPIKCKKITPLCINCNGFYHIQSDPINAYNGIGIICDICGKNKNDNPQILLDQYYYQCESCKNIDICSNCYKNEKEKLKNSNHNMINKLVDHEKNDVIKQKDELHLNTDIVVTGDSDNFKTPNNHELNVSNTSNQKRNGDTLDSKYESTSL